MSSPVFEIQCPIGGRRHSWEELYGCRKAGADPAQGIAGAAQLPSCPVPGTRGQVEADKESRDKDESNSACHL